MATSDADRSVRVSTIVLLDHMRDLDLLEPADIDKISAMIFDPETRIRKVVAGFFLSNVAELYEETLENIGGSVDKVEKVLGDDKDSADGVPYTWLKYHALVKVIAKYDEQVAEIEKEDGQEQEKAPYKGFQFGEIQSRIGMAASSLFGEMEELQVSLSFGSS
jgi:hypothetical protein